MIVNIKSGQKYDVYIGRKNATYNLPQSIWANPFIIGRDGTRDEVVLQYKLWIQNQPELLKQLPSLKNKVLACWCDSDQNCHGKVLLDLANQLSNTLNKDGVDHINIYSKGETELGRLLSNFTKSTIITTDGEFASIEAYWYWLNSTSPDKEKLRFTYGFEAKKIGRELRSADWNNEDTFKLKIANAMISKLILNPLILDKLKESYLPFKHYYVYNDKTIEPAEGKWILETWEFLRNLAKNVNH